MTKQICTKCGETKLFSEFHKDSNRRSGIVPYCKACVKILSARYYAANTETTKARNAKWCSDNPEKVKALNLKWRANNRDKERTRATKWRAENPDKRKVSIAKYCAANRDILRSRYTKWREDNPEKAKAYTAKWAAANPESRRINEHNRRARKRENGGKLSHGLADKLFKLQRGKCACCGVKLVVNHLDHVIPLALGGPNEDWNMQLLCAPCNLSKHAKHPIDFMQSKGFLL